MPDSTANSGSGPIYFQMVAPSGTQWLGLGQGSGMTGANIFVMYAASDSNVTVSPRLGVGHVEPNFNSAAQITLLEGSGITSSGQMIANVRCDTCLSWSGGSMSPTNSRSDWIWAIKQGSALDSTSESAQISQHDTMGTFHLNLQQGIGGSSSNPFVQQQLHTSSTPSTATQPAETNGPSTAQTSTAQTTVQPSIIPVSPTATGSSSGSSSGFTFTNTDSIRRAHGTIMSLLFLVFFPLFALTLYLPTARRVRYVHAPLQAIGLVLLIVGLATGVVLGKDINMLHEYHQVIGYLVVATMILIQPGLGLYQHLYYHRTGGRSPMGVAHKVLGRTAIVAGVINGGLGLKLSGPVGTAYVPHWAVGLYSAVAIIVFIAYVVVVFVSSRRGDQSGRVEKKYGDGYEMHPSSGQRPTENYLDRPNNGNFARPNYK